MALWALLLLAVLACVWTPVADAKLVIHVVPHSHCDPGWLDTFEVYYKKQVQRILDEAFKAVQREEDRRFIWCVVECLSPQCPNAFCLPTQP